MGPRAARAEEAPARAAGTYTEGQLSQMIRAVSGPTSAVTHPSLSPTAQATAEDILQMWQLVQIVEGQRPAEGTMERRLYDRAVQDLGEGQGARGAANYLHTALRASISRLAGQVENRSDVGDLVDPLQRALATISQRANAMEENYLSYRPEAYQRQLAQLNDVIGGGTGVIDLSRTEVTQPAAARAGTTSVPTYDIPVQDLGRVHIVAAVNDLGYLAIGAPASDIVVSLFQGDRDAAQGLVDALGNARAADANREAQSVGCQDLLTRLQALQHPNITGDTDFQQAMADLRAGNRSDALRHLRDVESLGAAFTNTDQLDIVRVNNRGFSRYRAGAVVRIEMPNMADWIRYVRQSGGSASGLLWLSAGITYDFFNVSGERQRGTIDDTGAFRAEGDSTRLTGSGHLALIQGQVGFGSTIGGQPVEWVVHAQFGYRHWSLDPQSAELQTGTVRRDAYVVDEPYIGFTGVEVRVPGRGTDRPMFRITPERAGLGMVPGGLGRAIRGEDDSVANYMNFLGYATWPVNWRQQGGMIIRSSVTPQLSYFLQQFRVGGTLDAFQIQQQFRNGMALSVGLPSVRYDFNTATGVSTIELFGNVSLRPLPWLRLFVEGGGFWERGGESWNRIPDDFFVGAGAAFEFGRPSEESLASAVPTRLSSPVTDPVRGDYLGAARWISGGVGNPFIGEYNSLQEWIPTADAAQVSGAEGQRRARELAQHMGTQATAQGWTFTGDSNYTAAMTHLRAGRLQDGLAALAQVSAVQRSVEVTGDEGQRRARDLAALITRQATADHWDFITDDNYVAGLDHLRAGRLREGIQALRRVPAFRNMETSLTATPPTEGARRRRRR